MPLMGVQEVAALLGVTKQRVSQLADPDIQARARRPFPKPMVRLACGPLWRTNDVQAWVDAADTWADGGRWDDRVRWDGRRREPVSV
jgi:hypothetical protein